MFVPLARDFRRSAWQGAMRETETGAKHYTPVGWVARETTEPRKAGCRCVGVLQCLGARLARAQASKLVHHARIAGRPLVRRHKGQDNCVSQIHM